MTRIYVFRREEGIELLAWGHADYAEAGQDIVCAGVSALLYGFKAYLERQSLLCEGGRINPAEWDGGLWLRTKGFGGMDETAWEVTRAGLELIIRQYPQCVFLEEENLCREE